MVDLGLNLGKLAVGGYGFNQLGGGNAGNGASLGYNVFGRGGFSPY